MTFHDTSIVTEAISVKQSNELVPLSQILLCTGFSVT